MDYVVLVLLTIVWLFTACTVGVLSSYKLLSGII